MHLPDSLRLFVKQRDLRSVNMLECLHCRVVLIHASTTCSMHCNLNHRNGDSGTKHASKSSLVKLAVLRSLATRIALTHD